jgi:hypothetical protein
MLDLTCCLDNVANAVRKANAHPDQPLIEVKLEPGGLAVCGIHHGLQFHKSLSWDRIRETNCGVVIAEIERARIYLRQLYWDYRIPRQ